MKFDLKEKYIELYKLLKVMNIVSSGAEAKNKIANGEVLVNNEIETRKRYKVLSRDIITCDKAIITVVSSN